MNLQSLRRTGRALRATRLGLAALLLVGLSFPFVPHTLAARPAAKGTINIGTKNFGEEYLISRMYQLLLEKAGYSTGYHDLAQTPNLQAALLRGDIDLYPEYTGTGLQVLGNTHIITDPARTYSLVKAGYEHKYHLTWLQQSPMNDTNGVAVTQATARKYHLHTLSDLAKVAGQLSFAALVECKDRPDCYAGMKRAYGINFKSFTSLEAAPLRYKGLTSGQYDVVEVFTTDGPIKANNLVVLQDNKHAVFPADHIAPIVRDSVLHKYPQVAALLNRLAPYLTTQALKALNVQVVLNSKDPMAVARTFLRSKHLL